jgi:hypothetical protein
MILDTINIVKNSSKEIITLTKLPLFNTISTTANSGS